MSYDLPEEGGAIVAAPRYQLRQGPVYATGRPAGELRRSHDGKVYETQANGEIRRRPDLDLVTAAERSMRSLLLKNAPGR